MNFATFNLPSYPLCLILILTVIGLPVNGVIRTNNTQSEWESYNRWNFVEDNRDFLERVNSISPEAKMSTVEIIASRGYPVETHIVVSADGYILELHRIPYGKGQSFDSSIKRRAVYLQHGILNSDSVWLINPNDKSLAYVLADKGYDVWLGNSRGSTYSSKHISLDPEETAYWNFSFDESGKYDIPAVINYILGKTGRTTMSYVGYSMGCAMFFVCMHYRPELNAKIDVMIALAPATSMAESKSFVPYQAPFVNQIMVFFNLLNINVYYPLESPQNNFRRKFCGASFFLRNSICKNAIFDLTGDDYFSLDANILPVIDGHNPAGTSVKTAAHYAQIFNAGQVFQLYDYGSSENQLRYGQPTPPDYDLSKVTCPVHIYWGLNDKTVAPGDVAWLASKLGNLKASYQVEEPLWNHLTFVFSPDAKRLVYDKFIPLLPSTSI